MLQNFLAPKVQGVWGHDFSVGHSDSPGRRSDWPAAPSRLRPPELCNNPETQISSQF